MLQLLNETIHTRYQYQTRDVRVHHCSQWMCYWAIYCHKGLFHLLKHHCWAQELNLFILLYFTLFKLIVKDIGGYNNVNVVTLLIIKHYNVVINHMIVKHEDNFWYLVLY